MASARLGDNIGMRELELIKEVCPMAMKAHKSPGEPFLVDQTHSSSAVVFSFPGYWSTNGWFTHKPFGEMKIDRNLFPSLRSVGNDDIEAGKDGLAKVNKAFMDRFQAILEPLQTEVEKAVSVGKQIVFTGHSSGGPIAILATIWFLEKYLKPDHSRMTPFCVTFGCPLVGDRIFNHAIRRENWSRFFIHFVMRYDIVPRILLAPFVEQELQQILNFLNQRSIVPHQSNEAVSAFFINVMRNASSVANDAACHLMGNTNQLLETVSSFIELSPYRPFGTYVFYTGNGKLVVIKNPDAVLQVLFYSSQLNTETEGEVVAKKSLTEHMDYETKLPHSLDIRNVADLRLPLSTDGRQIATTNMILNDLGLSAEAGLCLHAAGEFEEQKLRNQKKIDAKKKEIEEVMCEIEQYKKKCEAHEVGYYDAFKISKDADDFRANVNRLKLAGIWDEIIEMLRSYELPDGFEGRKDWVELGTRFRRLVEPLDIANYYRHARNRGGPYMEKGGRPKRYRYTQRWLEHGLSVPPRSSLESCFWAEVEELSRTSNLGPFEDVRERILALEGWVEKWICDKVLGKEVFFKKSTFVKWWETLPDEHKSVSCIPRLVIG